MSTAGSIQLGRTGSGYLIRVLDRATLRESPAVRNLVSRCVGEENRPVFLDVSHCDLIDSTFLGCLVVLHKKFGGSGRLRIVASHEAVERLFRPSHCDQVLDLVEECPEPTKEFVTISVPELDAEQLGQHVMEAHRQLADLDGEDAAAFGRVAEDLARELGQAGSAAGAGQS